MLRAAPRVLVVDDDLPTCELIELALIGEGWDVQTRTCGQDALEVLQQQAVDVILIDLVMPEMDAETFLVRCRQQGTGDTPILLVSAAPNLEQQAARLGVSGALAKPFDLDDLYASLRQLVTQDQPCVPVALQLMVTEAVSVSGVCPRCNAKTPRLYRLPENARLSQAAPQAACYFCYVRLVGIKPTRNRLVR